MDNTHSTPFVKGVVEYVLDHGGGYWPCPEAFDVNGWAILSKNKPDTISGWIKDRKIPFRQIGHSKFVTPSDFWAAMDVGNAPEEPRPKGAKKRGD